MSAGFDLVLIGALLKVWSLFSVATFSALFALFCCCCCCCCMLLCFFGQRLNLVRCSVSMRLREKMLDFCVWFTPVC
ncbi:hypothetical protein CIPAW_05G242200 [Carya illinoinensis]|uniref:Uncharacterized protein n=1 Tax=Carya illinoinensis TaxID=32201 RepID=A0A8T1QN06_CARIL|nr:hypothetical protein CIPAW_05G242200 [Carya illinoinensis]